MFKPKFLKDFVKRWRTKRRIKHLARLPILHKWALEEFMINEMEIDPGDSLFIHSSFSDLKMDSTAEEVVRMIVSLIGSNGNILMPFYPLTSSYKFLMSGKVFDLTKNRTSMGALVQAFVQRPDVMKSIHPTKSVAIWGVSKPWLAFGHQDDTAPYGTASPYAKFTSLHKAKVIGLGVTSDFLSCVHVAVDFGDYPVDPYCNEIIEGQVLTKGGLVKVKTKAHNLTVTNKENVPKFLKQTKCPTYKEYKFKGRDFFSVDANQLVNHVISQGRKGKTFFY